MLRHEGAVYRIHPPCQILVLPVRKTRSRRDLGAREGIRRLRFRPLKRRLNL